MLTLSKVGEAARNATSPQRRSTATSPQLLQLF
jgi:hypothetical protein